MGIFDKLFRKPQSVDIQKAERDPSKDPDMIKVFDGYGREVYITKQQWKDNILIGNLEKVSNNPDELYSMLVGALQDGFSKDVVKYAEILHRIDKIPSRGATILAIIYMDCNRLDDSEKVLTDCIKQNGEEGYVLTNLAKVYSRRGDNEHAESILWHAIEIDPNQENGLAWFASIQNERGGESAYLDAYRKVAAFPNSWRAQLWLARSALMTKDIDAAKRFYEESITKSGKPIPAELLMQMSGDLGNNGYLKEIIELVEPVFDPSSHGILVGNNLIKTNFDLGQLTNAQAILDALYSQKRPDWRETLSFWDTELAKKRIIIKSSESQDLPAIGMVSIEGPIWCRDNSPFESILPTKKNNPTKIAIFGNTAIQHLQSDQPILQLSDNPGRASRAIPLFLAEKIHLSTNATGISLITWAQTQGFVVFGVPHDENEICELVGNSTDAPDYIVSIILKVINTDWEISANIISTDRRASIGKTSSTISSNNPGPDIAELSDDIIDLLLKYAGINSIPSPEWYVIPDGIACSNYLLRIEQLLALTCENMDSPHGGALQGVHEIVEGNLHLNVEFPRNNTIRMIFAQTLMQIKKYNPKILEVFRDRVTLLQKEHPLGGSVGELIGRHVSEFF